MLLVFQCSVKACDQHQKHDVLFGALRIEQPGHRGRITIHAEIAVEHFVTCRRTISKLRKIWGSACHQ